MFKRYGMLLIALVLLAAQSVLAQDEPLVFRIQWSPDGRWVSANTTQGVWFFDRENPDTAPLQWLAESMISTVDYDPSGRRAIVFNATDDVMQALNIESGKVLFSQETYFYPDNYSSVVYDLVYGQDGLVIVLGNTSEVYLLDSKTGEIRRSTSVANRVEFGNPAEIWVTSISNADADNSYILTDWAGHIMEYNAEDGSMSIHQLEYGVFEARPIPGENALLVLNFDGLFRYDLETETLATIDERFAEADGFALSADASLVAVGKPGGWLVYDTVKQEVVFEQNLNDPEIRVFSLAFNPDYTQVAVLSTDGHIGIWDTVTGEEIASLGDFSRAVSYKWG